MEENKCAEYSKYLATRNSHEMTQHQPKLSVKDLESSEQRDEALNSYPDGSEDSYKNVYSDDSDHDNNYDRYPKEEEEKNYDNYNSQSNKYNSDEYYDLSYPRNNEYYDKQNYDTKDTIDRQFDQLKQSIRHEEQNKFGFENYSKNKQEFLTFNHTFNGKSDVHSTYDSRTNRKYDEMPMKTFNHTDDHFFQKQNNELVDRLGIMKSAAARMIASSYEKSDKDSENDRNLLKNRQYDSEMEGFDSSTNNLIAASTQRIQKIDNVSPPLKK